jgi:transposase
LPPDIWDRTPPEAQAFILAMLAEVAALRAEVAELKARLDQNSSNSHKPPSSDPPSVTKPVKPPTGRKRGGQPGHDGHSRKMLPPERVHHRVDHHPSDCRNCGDSLSDSPVVGHPTLHQVCEIPAIDVTVTEHRRQRRRCQRCGTVTVADLPVSVAGSCFGPNLEALIAGLIGRYRLSRREALQFITDLTGLDVSLGTVVAICNRVSDSLAPTVDRIAETVRVSAVAYVDETGFKEAGQRRWLWVAVTDHGTLFRLHKNRSQNARRELLGAHVPGAKVVSDRAKAYDDIPLADRGLCHAHLKRDFEALKGRSEATTEIAVGLRREQRRLLVLHRQIRDGTIAQPARRNKIRMLKARFGALLGRGLELPDPKLHTLCTELGKFWPALFTCLDHPAVEPTNNRAERALRPAVIWRKTCFGTASEAGNVFVERLLTVAATCRQHASNLFSFIASTHAAARQGLTPPSLLPALS